jgi:TolB-like protein/tetratricopeptide (TPR) repeat protein
LSSDASPAVVRFGKFEVNLRSGELTKGGARVRLQEQPFQILALMLERPGELLTRDELQERLWPNGTFVDFEHGVNAAVKRLRAALGDNADKPRFVETLPRRGYRFIAPVEQVNGAVVPRFGLADAQKPRLAVLPFENVGRSPVVDFFSDGLTSEVIAQLGKVCANRLGVLARTSAMTLKNSSKSATEIARLLRADYLLDGTIRHDADRVRISTHLVESRGQTQVWADTCEHRLGDHLAVQADVASRIAHGLAIELLWGPRQLADSAATKNPAAYQAYLKGRYQWNRPSDDGVEPSLGHLAQAIALDPEFASAHALLARVYVAAAEYYCRPARVALESARALATRALSLEPTNSEAQLALADVRRALDWDWEGAEDAYRAALAFNPSNEAAHRKYGLFLSARNKPDAAALATDRAYDLDPLCLVVNTGAATARYFARRYDEAAARCRATLDMDPAFVPARRLLAAVLVQLERYDDALAELETITADESQSVTASWTAHAFAAAGHRDRATAILNRLAAAPPSTVVSSYHHALGWCGLREFDRAVTLLETACEERDPALTAVAVEPRLDPLRADRRFAALTGRLALR